MGLPKSEGSIKWTMAPAGYFLQGSPWSGSFCPPDDLPADLRVDEGSYLTFDYTQIMNYISVYGHAGYMASFFYNFFPGEVTSTHYIVVYSYSFTPVERQNYIWNLSTGEIS